jgi:hypothetical protein
VRARSWLSPNSVCPDRFLMLLEAVIVILKIRRRFLFDLIGILCRSA